MTYKTYSENDSFLSAQVIKYRHSQEKNRGTNGLVVCMKFLTKEENKVLDIPTIQIRPNKTQPRKSFDEDELRLLAQSIATNGILQPLTVRRLSQTEFELIAGERRLRAAVLAGLTKVPCVLIKCSDKESAIFALLENIQRADLNMFEEARGINRLIRKYGLTQEDAAARLGKKQSTVANKLRLLKLSMEEQDWILQAGLSERHARALLRINEEEVRKEVLSRIVAESLSAKDTEDLVIKLLCRATVSDSDSPKQEKKFIIRDVRIFVNTINKAVDTMRLSGINAVSKKMETEEYIEYTVQIPKKDALEKPDKKEESPQKTA